jgi:hypothetical protein
MSITVGRVFRIMLLELLIISSSCHRPILASIVFLWSSYSSVCWIVLEVVERNCKTSERVLVEIVGKFGSMRAMANQLEE